MPKETIEITICEMEWYLAGAQFLATLAYPDPLDEKQRGIYAQALIRWTLEWRIENDHEWASSPQPVRPAYFSGSDKQSDAALKRGNKRLWERKVAAYYLAVPHFKAVESGRLLKKHWLDGLYPSVANMSLLAVDRLRLSDGSVSTFKSRVWRPSRPVIHAATALHVWETFFWNKKRRSAKVNPQLAMMILPEYVTEIVEISEELRSMIPQITQFKINDSDTLRFETVESQNSGQFLQLPMVGTPLASSSFHSQGDHDDNEASTEDPEPDSTAATTA